MRRGYLESYMYSQWDDGLTSIEYIKYKKKINKLNLTYTRFIQTINTLK